ncbi:kinase-like protein [Colletotrichum falcatum]|nr:kinase-like protein [Colletotrichum falcatum]
MKVDVASTPLVHTRTRSRNSELKAEVNTSLDTMAELGSNGDDIDLDAGTHGHPCSDGHSSPNLEVPPINRARDIPAAWNVDFPGGSDILGGKTPTNFNDKRRKPSQPDTVVSVYDMGLGTAPGAPYDCHHLDLDRSEAIHSIEDDIRAKMEGRLCWSRMDQKEYLPRSAFDEIFTVATVKSLTRAIYPYAEDEELSQKIVDILGDTETSRRMIIATLVMMKQTGYIEDFIQEGIFDHDMPLRHERKSMRAFRTRPGPADRDGDVNTTLFRKWERVHVDLFYIYQKMIVVPIFEMDDGPIRSHILHRDVRLPWTRFQHKTSGGHGVIHQLHIHKSHCRYQGSDARSERRCFAVKEIHANSRESYRQELRALEMTCAQVQKERHLVKLLFTMEHGDKLYLVFEWADGNLQEFWARRRAGPAAASAGWMQQQCRGIANAVKRIHGLATWQKNKRMGASGAVEEEVLPKDWGRHGDIKPSNILWFAAYGQDRDHLVVADLGLTRYHSLLTRSRVSRVDGYTGTYRAPEIDLGDPISARYDIWSLGCVFLEFCVWYLLGADAIAQFENDRRLDHRQKRVRGPGESDNGYFVMVESSGSKKAVLAPAVTEWVRKLEQLESCTPFACRMLSLVTKQMLVVDAKGRSSIDVISSELLDMDSTLPGLAGGQARSSGTVDALTEHLLAPRQTSVNFAGAISVISDDSESDEQSCDEASNMQSTVATSVVCSELDYRFMR